MAATNTGVYSAPANELIMPAFFGYRYTVIDSACSFPEHVHHDHEVIYVDAGQYRCSLNGEKMRLEPNNLLVVKPGDRHADAFAPPLRCFAIGFQLRHPAAPDAAQSIFAEPIDPRQQVLSMRRDEIVPLIDRMRAEASVDDAFSSMIGDALLREFFWRTIRAFGPDLISPAFMRLSAEQGWHIRLRQMLRAHRGGFASVGDMAASLGVSERTLTKRCHEILRASPSQALMSYKLDEAVILLRQTDLSIQQVSLTLGFSNPFHFSAAFKRRFGESPSATRRRP